MLLGVVGLFWIAGWSWLLAHYRTISLRLPLWLPTGIVLLVVLWIPAPLGVVFALWLTFAWCRSTEVLIFPHRYTPMQTFWLTLFLIDPRQQARIRQPQPTLQLLLFGVVILATVPLWIVGIRNVDSLYLKILLGSVGIYAAAAGSDRTVRGVLSLRGIYYAPFHRTPIVAASISEFWNERWNRVVAQFLRTVCFVPFAKRTGAVKGAVLFTFLISAVLHMIPILLCLQLTAALAMGGFFAIHGLLVVTEHHLHIVRWPLALRRFHVLFWFALTLPLFILPFLQALGLIHIDSIKVLLTEFF